jgi:hypothetical protein
MILIYDLTSKRKYLYMSIENIKFFQADHRCDVSGYLVQQFSEFDPADHCHMAQCGEVSYRFSHKRPLKDLELRQPTEKIFCQVWILFKSIIDICVSVQGQGAISSTAAL